MAILGEAVCNAPAQETAYERRSNAKQHNERPMQLLHDARAAGYCNAAGNRKSCALPGCECLQLPPRTNSKDRSRAAQTARKS